MLKLSIIIGNVETPLEHFTQIDHKVSLSRVGHVSDRVLPIFEPGFLTHKTANHKLT